MRPRNPALSPSVIEQLSDESRHSGTSGRPRDGFADLAVITDIDDERLWI